MKKACVLLVTYNRREYLSKLLEALNEQTYEISGLVIVNNNSTDDTEKMLLQKKYIDKKIEKDKVYTKKTDNGLVVNYYSSSVNTGGSGGFNKAFEILLELDQKYDYVWVMDDDVLPDPECFEKLKENIKGDVKFCIPNRNFGGFEDMPILKFNKSNPFRVFMQKKKYLKNIEEKTYYIEDMPFEGPLFTYDLVKKVGLPDKEYFIFYDDSDYCTRCLQYAKGLYVTDAKLYKQIIPKKTVNKRMNWRHYYLYRNCILFDKKFGKNVFVRKFTPVLFIFELYLKNLLLLRFHNFKVIHLAAKDGFRGISGKKVEPGKF